MENPNTARGGVRAFRAASTATLASPVDATCRHDPASPKEARFVWDRRSNSIERATRHLRRGYHG
jgi:hypothetical protein